MKTYIFSQKTLFFGFCLLLYRLIRSIIIRYLVINLSIKSQTAILRFQDLNITPSILFFFGIILLGLGLLYNILGLFHSREKDFKQGGLFYLTIYIFFYLTAYPIILITSIYKFFKGKKTWN